MELVLVRHALPVRVDATEHGGPADPGLSELGLAPGVAAHSIIADRRDPPRARQ